MRQALSICSYHFLVLDIEILLHHKQPWVVHANKAHKRLFELGLLGDLAWDSQTLGTELKFQVDRPTIQYSCSDVLLSNAQQTWQTPWVFWPRQEKIKILILLDWWKFHLFTTVSESRYADKTFSTWKRECRIVKFSFPYGPFSGRSAWAASKISQNKPFFGIAISDNLMLVSVHLCRFVPTSNYPDASDSVYWLLFWRT